eukprot:3675060-Prymnesium_polylepis.1
MKLLRRPSRVSRLASCVLRVAAACAPRAEEAKIFAGPHAGTRTLDMSSESRELKIDFSTYLGRCGRLFLGCD